MKNKVLKTILCIILLGTYGISMFLVTIPFLKSEIQDAKAEKAASLFVNQTTQIEQQRKNVESFRVHNERMKQIDTNEEISEKDFIEKYHSDFRYVELLKAMIDYNEKIYHEHQVGLCDAWSYKKSVLNLSDYGITDGVVGAINIPRMDITLPIYLGATSENLGKGAAHLTETSMPIGGVNTNCVIAGHRGWNNGKYLKDIELVQVNDEVIVTNLWYTMHYKVTAIKLIRPNEVEKILIQDGKDLLTIMTCHPYGTGGRYYRYLLVCERVPEDDASVITTEDAIYAYTNISDWTIRDNQSVHGNEIGTTTTNISIYSPGLEEDPNYVSSKNDIAFENFINYTGVALTLLVPLIAVFSAVRSTKHSKKKGR